MIYAIFNSDGLPQGFYIEGINVIPDGSVEITEEQWGEFINNQGLRRWDGSKVIEYAPPPPPEVTPPLLAWQFKTVVALAFPPPEGGAQLDGLRALIRQAIADPVQQNIALSRLESPPDGLYYITDPLFSNDELMAATGKSEADIQAMWAQGLGLPG